VSVLGPESADAGRLSERRDAHRDVQQAAADVLLGGFGPDDDIDQRLAEAEHAGGHQWPRAASGSLGPRSCVRPSLTSISSSGTPLVSGITLSTQTSWAIIATKKMLNAAPAPNAPMIGGNANEVIAANTQWVRLPSDWPRPRIRFG